MIYETSLKKLAEKQAMNERGSIHATLTEVISLVSQKNLPFLNFWPSITSRALKMYKFV